MQNEVRKRPAGGTAWPLVLSWLSGLLLVALAAVLVLQTTVCSKSYMQKRLEKSDYGDVAYTYLTEDFKSYAAASGFASEVLTSQISAEQITADMQQSIAKLYEGDTALEAHNEIFDATLAAMKADAESRGYEITSTVEEGIALVAETCREKYSTNIWIPLASTLYGVITRTRTVLWPALAVVAVLCVVSLVLSVRLARNAAHGARCIVFSFFSAAIVCGLLAFGVNPLLNLGNLSLNPLYLKLFFISYVQGILGQFSVFLVLYGVVGLVVLGLLCASHAMQRKAR